MGSSSGQGSPKLSDILALAKEIGISNKTAMQIIDKISTLSFESKMGRIKLI